MKRIGLFLSAACIGTGAFAAYPSVYIDIGGGYASQQAMPSAGEFANISGVSSGSSTSSTSENLGGRAAIGLDWATGQRTSFGIELGAAAYGSTKYSQENASLDLNYYGYEFLGVGRLHLSKMALIFKGGIVEEMMNPGKDNVGNSGTLDLVKDSETILPEVGLGLGYQAGKHAQLSTMYYHTFGEDVSFDTQTGANNLPSINAFDLELTLYY